MISTVADENGFSLKTKMMIIHPSTIRILPAITAMIKRRDDKERSKPD